MKKYSETQISPTRKKSTDKSSGCSSGVASKAKTLAGLVREYENSQKSLEGCWNPLKSLMEGYRELESLDAAIKSAALAEDLVGKSYQEGWNGRIRRHGHQRRIKLTAVTKSLRILRSRAKELQSCRTFESIYEIVSTLRTIKGIGPLYVYDTALRIGAYRKKYPGKIYLHAGALSGARSLLPNSKKLIPAISEFPIEMHHLATYEIEDFLCIYKTVLADMKIKTKKKSKL